MKYVIIFIAIILSKLAPASSMLFVFCATDTIAPPPGFPSTVSGPVVVCVDDTVTYTADIPLNCNALWYVDDVLQSSTTGELQVIWSNQGDHTINLNFECDTTTYPSSSLLVTVNNVPDSPSSIQGDTKVCNMSTKTYTTEVSANEVCRWVVDGIIQPSDSTTMSYYWVELGTHLIEVSAVNDCGLSAPEYLDATVFTMPVVNLGNDTTINQGQTITLNADNLGSKYLWNTGDTTQTIIVSQSGYYEVVVSNACGDVSDNINVDVVVGVNKIATANMLIIITSGNNITFDAPNISIKKIQVWDMKGRLIIYSCKKSSYFFPYNGIYIFKAVANDGTIFRKLFIK